MNKREVTRKWRQEWHSPARRCLVSEQKNRGCELQLALEVKFPRTGIMSKNSLSFQHLKWGNKKMSDLPRHGVVSFISLRGRAGEEGRMGRMKPREHIESAKAALKWLFKHLEAQLLCSTVSRVSSQSHD